MTPTHGQLAAVERVRRFNAGALLEEIFGEYLTLGQATKRLEKDRSILADAYLQHLDASRDDGETVDEAWLLSIGFEKWGGDGAYRGYYLKTHLRSYMLHSNADGWKFSIGSTTLLVNPTRGQLRRLLEALQINISAGA
jgi:hypothetical protein